MKGAEQYALMLCYFWTHLWTWSCVFMMCVRLCSQQAWPSLSWCCWPAWTRAPTRGSTRLFPAACPESFKTCSTVGRDSAGEAPCQTTPPPRTPPPPRTHNTDRTGEEETGTHTETRREMHQLPCRATAHWSTAAAVTGYSTTAWKELNLYQMFAAPLNSCFVSRTLICYHLSAPPL